ncbi:MAG: aminoacyl-tRNA hydrolase [Patescibacteria group bacterium]
MKLIVGLGNPGKKYEKSRHNIGFMVVDELAQKWEVGRVKWEEDKKSNTLIINHQPLAILVKPQTMMNASGFAVKSLITNYKLPITNLWVIHDDLDLPLGKIKIVKGRGSAGHYGVGSIIRELGTADFVRFRLGIGRPAGKPPFAEASGGKWEVGGGRLVDENVMHREVERYVLEGFGGKEAVEAKKTIKKTVEAIELALEKGVEEAMNRYNK